MDQTGNLYGTTVAGGAYGSKDQANYGFPYGYGTAFKLTPPSAGGGYSVLWNFGHYPQDGYWPQAGLIMDRKGNLYGTTVYGGAYGSPYFGGGTAFKLTADGKQSIIWNFGGGADGSKPLAGLIMGAHGDLYGTTSSGGLYGGGTVFQLSLPLTSGGNWTESILWNFGNGADGAVPFGGLIMDKSGNLYGTTSSGGLYGGGTVFEVSTSPSTGP
jgi:uncharacterized repeat protein (TIGR03803 family)